MRLQANVWEVRGANSCHLWVLSDQKRLPDRHPGMYTFMTFSVSRHISCLQTREPRLEVAVAAGAISPRMRPTWPQWIYIKPADTQLLRENRTVGLTGSGGGLGVHAHRRSCPKPVKREPAGTAELLRTEQPPSPAQISMTDRPAQDPACKEQHEHKHEAHDLGCTFRAAPALI